MVASAFGASESGLRSALLTMLSGVKDGAWSLLSSARKHGRKRSAASSRSAAATLRFYHVGQDCILRLVCNRPLGMFVNSHGGPIQSAPQDTILPHYRCTRITGAAIVGQ